MATMWCRNEIVRWTLQRIAFFQSKGGWSVRFTHKTSRVFWMFVYLAILYDPFFGLVQRPFQRLIDPQLRIKTSLWITWYIVLHTYLCTHPIGYDILVVPSSPPQPNRICHSLFGLQQGRNPSPTNYRTTFSGETNNLWYMIQFTPPKKKKKTDVSQKVFFLNFLRIILYYSAGPAHRIWNDKKRKYGLRSPNPHS